MQQTESPSEIVVYNDMETVSKIEERLGPGQFPGFSRPLRSLFWLIFLCLGSICLILILAILAAIPGLNILTLGYLLEAQKKVALSGRLRDGFPLLTLAPRLGIVCFFTVILLIPLQIQAARISDAAVILGPESAQVQQMQKVQQILQAVIAVHISLSVIHGGAASCFLRPFRNLRMAATLLSDRTMRNAAMKDLEQVIQLLNPVRHLIAGFRGFAGAICWLVIPAGLLVSNSAPDHDSPQYGIVALIGIILLIPVTAWLPMLQVHQAVNGRFRSIFAVKTVRRLLCQAPLSWMFTTILLYVLTLPLYLTSIRLPPSDALLLLTPLFIVLIYPARIFVAWAYFRGTQKEQDARAMIHRPTRILMIPILGAYGIFLFLTPYFSQLGGAAPMENAAFLGPVPAAQNFLFPGRVSEKP